MYTRAVPGTIGTRAAQMFAGNEISRRDALAALGVTTHYGRPGSVELAMIANGGVPGSFRLSQCPVTIP